MIVYAALGGKNGGLWRSLDGGNHWTNLSAGVIPRSTARTPRRPTSCSTRPAPAPRRATSTSSTPPSRASASSSAANRGQALTELLGNVGADNLIQNSQFAPALPLTVNDANTPNGAFGRIVLAKPALTNNAAQNILYQDWLYAAVENTDGTFRGLYVTKDRGENWTLAQIASDPRRPA